MDDLKPCSSSLIIVKDTNRRIISCDENFLKYAGVNSVEKVFGRTDHDDFPWSEFADIYLIHEEAALLDNTYSTITPSKDYTNRLTIYMNTRSAKKDNEGNIIGINLHAVELINPRWDEYIYLLSKQYALQNEAYTIGKVGQINLTAKEKEVLFYLSRGKSAKDIALILRRSFRTIEHRIERIKEKFGCKNSKELISMAIYYGYNDMLPNDTIENLLKKIKV